MVGIIKKRSLHLAEPLTSQQEKTLTKAFSELTGVSRFEVKISAGRRITYDLRTRNLQSIEKIPGVVNPR